jgi:hypothetical protein
MFFACNNIACRIDSKYENDHYQRPESFHSEIKYQIIIASSLIFAELNKIRIVSEDFAM